MTDVVLAAKTNAGHFTHCPKPLTKQIQDVKDARRNSTQHNVLWVLQYLKKKTVRM